MASYSGQIFWRCSCKYTNTGVRAALLRDDGAIGYNTLIATASRQVNEPSYLEFTWPNTYDGNSPVAFRVRFPLYGIGDIVVPYPPSWSDYNVYRYERWLALVLNCNYNDQEAYPADVLPNYDPDDGTSYPNPLFSVPQGCVWTGAGARMMRCDGTQIILTRYLYQAVFGGSTDKQHPCPVATQYDSPILDDTMWELEYAEYTVPTYRPELSGAPWHIYTVDRWIYPMLEWYGRNKYNGQWEGPFYSAATSDFIQVRVIFRRPWGEPTPPYSWKASHNIDHDSLLLGQANWIHHHNLFSLTRTDWRECFPTGYVVQRVRHIPRFHAVLALAKSGTSFSLRICEINSDRQTEVLTMTATSAMVEIAEDQRTALLVYSLSDNTVYRRVSRDGGWTWSSAQQCTLSSGGNLSVQALSDLDYSPRRRCWFLVAQTASQTFKVYASEDGLVWTDTGL